MVDQPELGPFPADALTIDRRPDGDPADINDSAPTPDHSPDLLQAELAEVVESPVPVPPEKVLRDEFGGYVELNISPPSGFFTTAMSSGRAWLVDPLGNAFFSLGVQAVGFGSLEAPALGYAPGTLAQYARHIGQQEQAAIPALVNQQHLQLMKQAGFNTVGGWSGGVWEVATGFMPYSLSLGFAGGVQGTSQKIPAVSSGGFPDVFHPGFPDACLEYATKAIPAGVISDPWNLGYYSDNELKWWGAGYFLPSAVRNLADDFIDEAPDAPGKQAFVAFMQGRYASIDQLNQAYGMELADWEALAQAAALPFAASDPVHQQDREEFVELIAHHYFQNVDQALKLVDPNHLNLCVRFASIAPEGAIRKAGEFCDVVSFNDYYIQDEPLTMFALGGPAVERWERHAKIAFEGGGPKPFLVTEWGTRAVDSGLPNTFGAGYTVPTQQDRAEFYRWSQQWFFERHHQELHYVAGWHWFMYMDEPATGRFDGEDCNYGIVTIRDELYRFTVDAMESVNRIVDNLLVAAVEPSLLPPPKQVMLQPGQDGTILVQWDAVPLAESYLVWVLSHPAGIAGRMEGPYSRTTADIVLDLSALGGRHLWVGVQSVRDDLLSGGTRVGGPVVMSAGNAPAAGVLACETMATVTIDNQLSLPNDRWGQTYVRLVDSFLGPQFGQALELEFLASSLGVVGKKQPPPSWLRILLTLPQPLELSPELPLSLSLLAHPLMLPTNQMVPSTRFVLLRGLDTSGNELVTWPLEDLVKEAGATAALTLPVPQPAHLATLEFLVEATADGLPLEQSLRLTIDDLKTGP